MARLIEINIADISSHVALRNLAASPTQHHVAAPAERLLEPDSDAGRRLADRSIAPPSSINQQARGQTICAAAHGDWRSQHLRHSALAQLEHAQHGIDVVQLQRSSSAEQPLPHPS